MRKTYEETVDVSDASAEDLFKKIKLYLIEHTGDAFQDFYIYTESGMLEGQQRYTNTYSQRADLEPKIKEVFDEANNHIIFKYKRELIPRTFKYKNKVTRTEVFVSPGQYRLIGTVDSISAKKSEIEKELEKITPEVEENWNVFAADMKKAIKEQITDEEFENLIQSGQAELENLMQNGRTQTESNNNKNLKNAKEFTLKAVMARPNDARALYYYGMYLANTGVNYANRSIYSDAIIKFNMALYVLGLAHEYPKSEEAISKTLQDKGLAEQMALSARK